MSRYTTDDVKKFSIFFLNKRLRLEPDCTWYHQAITWSRNGESTGKINYDLSTVLGNSYIELSYRIRSWGDDEWQSINYKVPLEAVECRYGGIRWYFRCPLYRSGAFCGRRVGVLYEAGRYFGCRHCADLTYESCNQSKRFRTGMYKVFSDSFKAEEIYESLKRLHYAGKPTRKYRKCLKLWSSAGSVQNVERAIEEALS